MARDTPCRVADDDRGQMMILTAVILLIGFIALAGMVSRVNQLSSQTAIESERIILREVGPLAESMNSAICKLKASTTTPVGPMAATVDTGPGGFATAKRTSGTFAEPDIGMFATGSGILPGTRITAVAGDTATLSTAPATSGPTSITNFALKPCTTTSFLLTGTELEVAVVATMNQLEALQAAHGLFMGWRIDCGDSDPGPGVTATTANSQVVAHLWDGTVWVEVRSAVLFTRATDCALPLTTPLFPISG